MKQYKLPFKWYEVRALRTMDNDWSLIKCTEDIVDARAHGALIHSRTDYSTIKIFKGRSNEVFEIIK